MFLYKSKGNLYFNKEKYIMGDLQVRIIPSSTFSASKVQYVNNEGKTVTKNISSAQEKLFNLLNKYTKDTSSIDVSKFPQLLQDIELTTISHPYSPTYNVLEKNEMNTIMRNAVEDFTKDFSDEGITITEKEIRMWYDRIAK